MVANYVTGRRVKVRIEKLINAWEMEMLSRGPLPRIFPHVRSPSYVFQESQSVGGWRFNNNWKQSDRVECVGEEVEEMCTTKVVRLNVELQLHFSESVKGCMQEAVSQIHLLPDVSLLRSHCFGG